MLRAMKNTLMAILAASSLVLALGCGSKQPPTGTSTGEIKGGGKEEAPGQSFGRCDRRLTFDFDVLLRDRSRGGVADRGETQQAQRTNVFVDAIKLLEEKSHAVRAREHDPIVGAELGDNIMERVFVDCLCDANQRQLDDLGAERAKSCRELGRLFAGARHDNASTGQVW